MNKVFIAPGRYVQGRNALSEAGVLVGALGKRVMTLWDAQVKAIVGETLLASLQGAGLTVEDVLFNGDSTKAEAARVAQLIQERKVDVIMGVGGGKTLDTAKAARAKPILRPSPGAWIVGVVWLASIDVLSLGLFRLHPGREPLGGDHLFDGGL